MSMSREIKFRAKTATTNRWAYGHYAFTQGHHVIYEDGEPFVIVRSTLGQYTGLKDKNGIEIYEGDVLYFEPFETHSNNRVVEYIDGAYHGRLIRNGYSKLLAECVYETKVIGNIYENPELLEVES